MAQDVTSVAEFDAAIKKAPQASCDAALFQAGGCVYEEET